VGLPDICQKIKIEISGKDMNATHFEFELNDKIGGSERETTPEPSLCDAARN
jgi:hypothetical protein